LDAQLWLSSQRECGDFVVVDVVVVVVGVREELLQLIPICLYQFCWRKRKEVVL
jgi:hypothetical protein